MILIEFIRVMSENVSK